MTRVGAAYDAGRYADALKSFRTAMTLVPSDPVPAFDAASALFQLGRFDEAQPLYLDARRRAGAALRTKIDYALGNTAAARGEFPEALGRYDDCLASTASGPDLDRVRRDAAINRRFVEERRRTRGSPPSPGERTLSRNSPPPKTGEGPGSTEGPGKSSGKGTHQDGPAGKRGAGGAGGGGQAPPEPGSPEDQLAQALENVREARRRRIEETTAPDESGDRKDW